VKGTDRLILSVLLVGGLAVAFYLMVLAPKREEASKLTDEVEQLEASVAQQERVVEFAEAAKQDFPRYYGRLAVLGKAVPEAADSASLLVQLSRISSNADVEFRGLQLAEGSTAASSAAPPAGTAPTEGAASVEPSATDVPPADAAAAVPPADPAAAGSTASAGSTATAGSTAASAPPTPATEAIAASLPIGATVGPAGLGTLPYELTFRGQFFQVADFIAGLDRLVDMREGGHVAADGRLLTIDGFALSRDERQGFPWLEASFTVTSYVAPLGQGLTAGATPTAPAPAVPTAPAATPTSATGVTP
jgi:hypothetical protein